MVLCSYHQLYGPFTVVRHQIYFKLQIIRQHNSVVCRTPRAQSRLLCLPCSSVVGKVSILHCGGLASVDFLARQLGVGIANSCTGGTVPGALRNLLAAARAKSP